jgi:hypothetical protein
VTPVAELSCRCGKVGGRVTNATPNAVNRAVCYCDDCQAALHHLGRKDLLNEHGGTDVVQVAPASLTFHRGNELIVGLRLTPKGLYRWHTSCCNTPVGNTLGPGLPFVGIVARAFETNTTNADRIFGAPLGGSGGKFATGNPPKHLTRLTARLVVHAVRLVLGWKFGGGTWPHPFFDRETRAPTHPITVLSPAEREALRPLCGPNAAK